MKTVSMLLCLVTILGLEVPKITCQRNKCCVAITKVIPVTVPNSAFSVVKHSKSAGYIHRAPHTCTHVQL